MEHIVTTDPAAELTRWFGHASFRPGQEPVVRAVLEGRDVLAVMPTGSGKSIGYQLPALMLPGLTLVVSPLISLMKDQVDELNRKQIASAAIHSMLSFDAVNNVMLAARAGALRLLYVAPERFGSSRFEDLLPQLPIARFAVDEAHCVSEWGHDFRPDYRRLEAAAGRCRRADGQPGRPPIVAMTATATPEVRDDIVDLLGLREPAVFVAGFDRPNLFLDVRRVSGAIEKRELLPGLVGSRRALVYASTRKSAEGAAETLTAAGIEAWPYHAGLADLERSRAQDGFAQGRIRVICATNAFGMGIDRPDVDVVVHLEIPGSLESYYQEIGRAGRDGRAADITLLWNYVDVRTREFFIEKDDDDGVGGGGSRATAARLEPEQRERKRALDRKKLQRMIGYADSTGCYRATLLGYFGEFEVPLRCGSCGNCRRRTALTDDQLTHLRKILSGVARGGERWGRKRIVAMLRGDEDLPDALMGLSTTGLLEAESASRLADWLDAAVGAGLLAVSDDQYRTLSLTRDGRNVLAGRERSVDLTLPEPAAPSRRTGRRRTRGATAGAAASTEPGPPVDEGVLAALRAWRREVATERQVPAYVVLHDKTLIELASRRPASLDALADVSGIGPAKLESYGPDLVALVMTRSVEGTAQGSGLSAQAEDRPTED